MNITEAFIDYLNHCNHRITEGDLEKARYCLLDYVGSVYAGAHENANLLSRMNFEAGECYVIGTEMKTDALTAAFVNAYNAHTMELDDGHRFAAIHLGAVIISALIATAQDCSDRGKVCSTNRLLSGIVIGYEAAVRCGMAMQPGHKNRGYHTSGTCGAIGAAVGIGIMLGYNREQLKSTVSGAATSAAGFLEIQEDASEMKPYNVGHAAMAGVMAAKMGALGFRPPDDILGGSRGVLRVMTDTFSERKLLDVENYLEIERIYVKPYASCRHCHSAVEAALQIRKECDLDPNEIDRIVVNIYGSAVQSHDHTVIHGAKSAKLSIPYSVAAAYILQDGGLRAFTADKICDHEILSLAKKVTVLADDEFSRMSPEKRVSEVQIFSGGQKYVNRVDFAKGEPENPMTEEEIRAKFYDLMQWTGEQQKADRIISAIRTLR